MSLCNLQPSRIPSTRLQRTGHGLRSRRVLAADWLLPFIACRLLEPFLFHPRVYLACEGYLISSTTPHLDADTRLINHNILLWTGPYRDFYISSRLSHFCPHARSHYQRWLPALLPRRRPQGCPHPNTCKATLQRRIQWACLTIRRQLHGFTGSSNVWQRNIPALAEVYRVIAPDLRSHGVSAKPSTGHHVARLAMDLKEIIRHLRLAERQIRVIAGSLGCAIFWFVNDSCAR
jgi:hypothetical protein